MDVVGEIAEGNWALDVSRCSIQSRFMEAIRTKVPVPLLTAGVSEKFLGIIIFEGGASRGIFFYAITLCLFYQDFNMMQ